MTKICLTFYDYCTTLINVNETLFMSFSDKQIVILLIDK